MDLTYLPLDLCKNTKIKYLFNKYIISYTIANKSGKTIANKLENCFKEYEVPIQLCSDNVSEFTDKDVTKEI